MIQRPATPGAGTLPGQNGCNSAIVTWSTPLRKESTRLAGLYSGCVKPKRVTAIVRTIAVTHVNNRNVRRLNQEPTKASAAATTMRITHAIPDVRSIRSPAPTNAYTARYRWAGNLVRQPPIAS